MESGINITECYCVRECVSCFFACCRMEKCACVMVKRCKMYRFITACTLKDASSKYNSELELWQKRDFPPACLWERPEDFPVFSSFPTNFITVGIQMKYRHVIYDSESESEPKTLIFSLSQFFNILTLSRILIKSRQVIIENKACAFRMKITTTSFFPTPYAFPPSDFLEPSHLDSAIRDRYMLRWSRHHFEYVSSCVLSPKPCVIQNMRRGHLRHTPSTSFHRTQHLLPGANWRSLLWFTEHFSDMRCWNQEACQHLFHLLFRWNVVLLRVNEIPISNSLTVTFQHRLLQHRHGIPIQLHLSSDCRM